MAFWPIIYCGFVINFRQMQNKLYSISWDLDKLDISAFSCKNDRLNTADCKIK